MSKIRAQFYVAGTNATPDSDVITVQLAPVYRPVQGTTLSSVDENVNVFGEGPPNAPFTIYTKNPAVADLFRSGRRFWLDLTPVDEEA